MQKELFSWDSPEYVKICCHKGFQVLANPWQVGVWGTGALYNYADLSKLFEDFCGLSTLNVSGDLGQISLNMHIMEPLMTLNIWSWDQVWLNLFAIFHIFSIFSFIFCPHAMSHAHSFSFSYIEGILPEGPYLPCVSIAARALELFLPKGLYLPCINMVDRALMAGYPRYKDDKSLEHFHNTSQDFDQVPFLW